MKQYISGAVLFNLHTEQGFSLGLSLWALQDHQGVEVHWFSFFAEAYKKGMETYQIYNMLEAAYQDDPKVFPDFGDTMHRLRLYTVLFDEDYLHLCEADDCTKTSMKQQIEDEVRFLTTTHACENILFRVDGFVIPVGIVQEDNLLIFGKLKMESW